MTPNASPAPPAALTKRDRYLIAQARELHALVGIGGIEKRAGTNDTLFAYAQFAGEAKFLLGELAAIAERLGGDDA